MKVKKNRGIVITGGSGLLGINWALKMCMREPVVVVLHHRRAMIPNVKTLYLDLRSPEHLYSMLLKVRPTSLIHTAGLTNIEACEDDPQLAYELNILMAQSVAQACRDAGVKLVHISTDHLFDGSRRFAKEDWMVEPVNVYGKTKAASEVIVGNICNDALVVRTNFYGWGPVYRQSFSDIVIRELRLGNSLNLFDDVFYTPILIEYVIDAVDKLIENKAEGIYNIVGDDRVSKYEFGIALAKVFKLDNSLIRKGSILDMPQLVKRPRDMSLDNSKLKAEIGKDFGDLYSDLIRLRNLENTGLNPARLC